MCDYFQRDEDEEEVEREDSREEWQISEYNTLINAFNLGRVRFVLASFFPLTPKSRRRREGEKETKATESNDGTGRRSYLFEIIV